MQFPARYQSDVIQMLLRTKLEPDVEEWVEQGEGYAKDSNPASHLLSDHHRRELWQWAPSAANAEALKQKWGADYTLAEVEGGVEHIETGLKRELVAPLPDEDMDEEDEDEDEEEDEEGDEDEEAMEVDTGPDATTSSQPRPATGTTVSAVTVPQMPLGSVHKFMTTGKVG
jgi:mediator of RNA polymerase II transcription subunit 8, fungi type